MFQFIIWLKPCFFIFILGLLTTSFQCIIDLLIPLITANIIDFGILNNNFILILKNCLYMVLLALISIIFSFISIYFCTITSNKIGFILREKMFKSIAMFSIDEYSKYGIATLLNRITNDTIQIQQLILKFLCMIIPSIIYFLFGLSLIVYIKYNIIIYLLYLISSIIIFIILISNATNPLFKKIQIYYDKLGIFIREKISIIKIIKIFNSEYIHKQKYGKINLILKDSIVKSNLIISLLIPTTTMIINILIIFIFWSCSFSIAFNQMRIGTLLALVQYISISLFSTISTLDIIKIWNKAKISIKRLEDIEIDGDKSKENKKNQYYSSKNFLEELSSDWNIIFKNVSFSYPENKKRYIVKNLSFSIEKNKTTAIIGDTGSGKTTIVNLLLQFYDTFSGYIYINNINIKKIPRSLLRKYISWAPQQPFLFFGTIKSNIMYGNKKAKYSDLLTSSEISQSYPFIKTFKNGFESEISSYGKNLSGGQKQRLTIARTLIKKANLYIFDNITSSLDSITEYNLIKSLKNELKNKTVLFISQKIDNIKDVDKIIVLKEGEIVGIGTHSELIKSCQYYINIAKTQYSNNKKQLSSRYFQNKNIKYNKENTDEKYLKRLNTDEKKKKIILRIDHKKISNYINLLKNLSDIILKKKKK